MSIRSALGVLPAWPVLVVAPLIALGVGALSYGPTYRQCQRLAEARAAFTAAVARAAESEESRLRLDRAVGAPDWDEVRILQDLGGLSPEGPVLDCPFGWDLDRTERRAMLADGRLSILAFAKAGEVVDIVEVRGDLARFEGVGEVVARAEAVFAVERPSGPSGKFILRPLAAAKPHGSGG